jgi:hybrid cluster-associated redox disulfide protein
MDRTTRAFVFASLVYLVAGAVLGTLMAVIPQMRVGLLFTHVHLLLAGFMAMMIFGVGYFILPRFVGRGLQWPSMVPAHFWLANVSLIGLAVARPMQALTGSGAWGGIVHLAAVVQLLSLCLFAANLGVTLLASSKPAAAAASPPERPRAEGAPALRMAGAQAAPSCATLGAETPVGEIVDRKEGAQAVLVEAGLTPLRDPAHLEMVRRAGIPLAQACTRHGIPLDELLERLRALPDRATSSAGGTITPDHVIGELVRRHPATREVLRTRFGDGCFTCPGFETETLAQGAMMHGVDVGELIADLERAAGGGGG